MKRYIATGLMVVLCNLPLISLQAQIPFIHFHHLTTADGLSNNQVNAIYQDRDGFLWFATNEGLDRYDGKHFLIFRHRNDDSASVASSIITDVTGDQHGNIWVSTVSGISCLHPYTKNFDNYYVYTNIERYIAGFNKVACLSSGEVIGLMNATQISPSRLYKVDLKSHRLYSLTLQVMHPASKIFKPYNRIILLNNGWIIYQLGKELFISKDGGAHSLHLNPNSPFPANVRPDDFFLIYADSRTCWFSNGVKDTKSQLLAYNYLERKWKILKVPYRIILSQGNIYGNHCYWFSGYTSGLLRVNVLTGKSIRFLHNDNDPSSITDNSIYGSYVDRQGTLWLATEGGVDYWNQKEDNYHYINNKISGFENFGGPSWGSMAEDASGKLWMGSVDYSYPDNALFSFDPETMKFHRYHGPMSINHGSMPVWNILPLKHNMLLLSTQYGIFEFNTLTRKLIRPTSLPFPHEITHFRTGFTILKKDDLGNFWFGLWNKGIIQYNPLRHSMAYFNKEAGFYQHRLSDNFVSDASEDKHHLLWVVYKDNNLLSCIDAVHSKVIKEFKLAYHHHSLLNDFSCICIAPSGKIWIGTMGDGLISFDPSGNKVQLYTFTNGLLSQVIYSLCFDKKGLLWLYTAKGIQCMNTSTGIFYNVDTDLPPPPGSIEGAPMIISHKGIMYAGFGKNFIYFNPDSALHPFKIMAPLPISVDMMGKPVFFSPASQTIHIYHEDYYFRILFTSLDMLRSRMLQYSYRLEGYNHYWINCGNEGIATFSHLPPGKYQLQMRATVPPFSWDGKYSSMTIDVIPAFYQTKLFRIVILILITATFYYMIGYFAKRKYHLRLAQLQRQQQIIGVRNRIAQDIHDDIGAGLTRISIQTELLKQNPATDKSEYQKILKIINKQTQDLIRDLGEIVWTINPSDDYLDNMLAYFRVYIHRFMEGSGLSYEINFPETENKRNVHPDLKRNLFLILKESLNNIIKHACAHQVMITFSVQNDDKYIFTIQDDGKGFDVQDPLAFSGNGLHNIRNRAWAINARVIYRSHLGQGTGINIEGVLY